MGAAPRGSPRRADPAPRARAGALEPARRAAPGVGRDALRAPDPTHTAVSGSTPVGTVGDGPGAFPPDPRRPPAPRRPRRVARSARQASRARLPAVRDRAADPPWDPSIRPRARRAGFLRPDVRLRTPADARVPPLASRRRSATPGTRSPGASATAPEAPAARVTAAGPLRTESPARAPARRPHRWTGAPDLDHPGPTGPDPSSSPRVPRFTPRRPGSPRRSALRQDLGPASAEAIGPRRAPEQPGRTARSRARIPGPTAPGGPRRPRTTRGRDGRHAPEEFEPLGRSRGRGHVARPRGRARSLQPRS